MISTDFFKDNNYLRPLSYREDQKIQGLVEGVAYDLLEASGQSKYCCSSSYVVAYEFLLHTYSRQPFSSKGPFYKGSLYCNEINIEVTLLDQEVGSAENATYEYHFSNQYLLNAYKVWNAVADILQNSCTIQLDKDPAKVEISANFIDHVFRPLIPNSPFLKWARSKKSSSFKKGVGFFGLFCETPVRLACVLSGHMLLYCAQPLCSEKFSNYLAYYQSRLNINAYSPLQLITKAIGSLI